MRRHLILLVAAVAGFAVALAAGIAGARSFTLGLSNVKVGTSQETIVVNARGDAVYWLSGDSSAHPKCTPSNHCFTFWPPVKVKSANGLSKAAGIKGKLGIWRHSGFLQLTLGGHPLYGFSADARGVANGNGIKSFGGTWHVISGGSGSGSGGMTTPGTTTTGTTTGTTTTSTGTTTTGTTTTTCAYPPYCY